MKDEKLSIGEIGDGGEGSREGIDVSPKEYGLFDGLDNLIEVDHYLNLTACI